MASDGRDRLVGGRVVVLIVRGGPTCVVGR
jgi:hypothetical protein